MVMQIERLNNIYILIFSVVCCVFFMMLPLSASAEVMTTYTGCYLVGNDEDSAELWLNAPLCELEIENTDNTDDAYTYIVRNLDPEFYQVHDDEGQDIQATRSETELDFSVYLEPEQTRIITVEPWGYDSEIDDFWFAAISDPQATAGGDMPNPVFEAIMQQLEQLALPFTTNSGDIIRGTDQDAEEHDAEYELNYDVYNQFAGTTLMVPGDHDARQDLATYYSSYFGENNYAFEYGNTLFIGINTIENYYDEGRLSSEQLEWVESELAAATTEHIIVFMHHPLVPPAWAASTGIVEDQRLELASLFAEYSVDLIICGDVHGYDYTYIDGDSVAGLIGGVQQLIAGGAGGSLYNFDGDHFFIMLHVTADGIEHTKMDYNSIDFSIDNNDDNDGTETEVSFNAINNSEIEIPYFRGKISLVPAEYYYASLSSGRFIPFISQEVDGILRGYVELSLEVDETASITVKQRTALLTNIENTINSDGLLVFDELPVVDNQETDISITASPGIITAEMLQWDTENNLRQWQVEAPASKNVTFQISALEAGKQYNIFQNSNLIDRLATNSNGKLSFTHSNKKTSRSYSVVEEADIPVSDIGVLPASEGGPNFRIYNNSGSAIAAFNPYDQDLEHGYESIWIDIDGDGELEIAIVPVAGKNGNVKVFEDDGSEKFSLFPFGDKFKGGINMVAGDIDGDKAQELILAAQSKKKSIVKIYTQKNDDLSKRDSFRVYNTKYKKGLNLAAGDLNGDGDDEIIVGATKNKQKIIVYRWASKKAKAKLWLSKKPFNSEDSTNGFTLTTADVDFDNKDEVIVGSYTGGAMIKVFNYQASQKQLSLKAQKRVFSGGFSGGVNIVAGNCNNNHKDEIIVTQRGDESANGLVRVYTYRNGKKRLTKLAQTAPYTEVFTGEIGLSLADVDDDDKLEVVAATGESGGSITMYDLKNQALQKLGSFYAYEKAFQGGLNLTQ